MRKTNILICGKILIDHKTNSPKMLIKSIKDFVVLRNNGKIQNIIYSTWDDEIDKFKGLRKFLLGNNVKIVESREPKNYTTGFENMRHAGPGNIWCQTKILDLGLREIDDNSYVLKTRPDIYIKPKFLDRLFSKRTAAKLKIPRNTRNIFTKKIWIPWFEITLPFHMADECFFGLCKDLKKLIHYDASYFVLDKIYWAPAHAMRFIHPFEKSFPLLKNYLENAADLSIYQLERLSVMELSLQEEVYLEFLALYYYLLKNYFFIETLGNVIQFREWSDPKAIIDEHKFKENFSPKKSWAPPFGPIFGYNKQWLNNVVTGKIKGDKSYDRFYKIYKKIEKYPHGADKINKEYIKKLKDYQEKIKELKEIAYQEKMKVSPEIANTKEKRKNFIIKKIWRVIKKSERFIHKRG